MSFIVDKDFEEECRNQFCENRFLFVDAITNLHLLWSKIRSLWRCCYINKLYLRKYRNNHTQQGQTEPSIVNEYQLDLQSCDLEIFYNSTILKRQKDLQEKLKAILEDCDTWEERLCSLNLEITNTVILIKKLEKSFERICLRLQNIHANILHELSINQLLFIVFYIEICTFIYILK